MRSKLEKKLWEIMVKSPFLGKMYLRTMLKAADGSIKSMSFNSQNINYDELKEAQKRTRKNNKQKENVPDDPWCHFSQLTYQMGNILQMITVPSSEKSLSEHCWMQLLDPSRQCHSTFIGLTCKYLGICIKETDM